MKYLITIYLGAGSVNLHADNENAARIAMAILSESKSVPKATLHLAVRPGELKLLSEFGKY